MKGLDAEGTHRGGSAAPRARVAGTGAPIARLFPASRDASGAVLIYRMTPDELVESRTDSAVRLAGRMAPLPRRGADRAVVEGWADFLAPHFANGSSVNLTGTYSDTYGYSHGLMLARNVIKDFAAFRRVLGRRSIEPACIGVERHPSGRDVLHFHALLGGEWTDAERARAQSEWTDGRGWSRAKFVTDREGCVEYAAKHLLKQRAEDHFEFWLPPAGYLRSRHERRCARAG
jgi:hypothetical protein